MVAKRTGLERGRWLGYVWTESVRLWRWVKLGSPEVFSQSPIGRALQLLSGRNGWCFENIVFLVKDQKHKNKRNISEKIHLRLFGGLELGACAPVPNLDYTARCIIPRVLLLTYPQKHSLDDFSRTILIAIARTTDDRRWTTTRVYLEVLYCAAYIWLYKYRALRIPTNVAGIRTERGLYVLRGSERTHRVRKHRKHVNIRVSISSQGSLSPDRCALVFLRDSMKPRLQNIISVAILAFYCGRVYHLDFTAHVWNRGGAHV